MLKPSVVVADPWPRHAFNIEVLNDDNPPSITVISPENGDTVDSITIFEVEAIDDNKISDVSYQVNQGDWRKMYYNEGDSYIASWNTQEANAGNGDHQITFKAIDMNSNEISEMVDITVFNEEDITYHTDESWHSEAIEFFSAIEFNREVKIGNSTDALKLMKIIDKIYLYRN